MNSYTVIKTYKIKVVCFVDADTPEEAEQSAKEKQFSMSDTDLLEYGLDLLDVEIYKRH